MKLEDDDGHPAVKLEDEDDDSTAAAPALPFVPPPFVPPFVPPALARRRCGDGLGPDRTERLKAFYGGAYNGVAPDVHRLPPLQPGVATIKIHDDLSVAFTDPHVPNEPQMQVMKELAKALMTRKHCIVEAPTGTGKTAAVFTPLLAYQAQQEELHGASNPSFVSRIIYVARTLPQLDKTGQELATYPYETLLAAPVAKEHLCMLPKEEGISRADQCRKACQKLSWEEIAARSSPRATHCPFLDKQNQLDLPQRDIEEYYSGGALAGRTVEEVKARADEQGICAYHVSRDLTNTAGASVVMLTYGQLFDPHLRACNKTDALLQNALVFIDEAHNVPDVCRQAATEALNFKQLQALADEVKDQLQILKDAQQQPRSSVTRSAWERIHKTAPPILLMAEKLIDYLSKSLDNLTQNLHLKWVTDGFTQSASLEGTCAEDLIYAALSYCGAIPSAGALDEAAAPPSPSALAALGAAGVGLPPTATGRVQQKAEARLALEHFSYELHTVEDALDAADELSSAKGAPLAKRKKTGRLGSLLSKLALCVGSDAACYTLILRRLSKDGEKEHRKNNADVIKMQLPELNIVCLSGVVAMRRVLELARCAVFASGTLGAASDFAREIGLGDDTFCAVSTDHLESVKTQLLPLVYTGSQHQPLRMTAEKVKQGKSEPHGRGVIDEAGEVLLRCAQNVPGGILVFFGSKSMCSSFVQRWARGTICSA